MAGRAASRVCVYVALCLLLCIVNSVCIKVNIIIIKWLAILPSFEK